MARELVETLKSVLKARNMTYADLAGALRAESDAPKRTARA